MPTEASIVKKSERAFDDLARLWKRRKLICVILLVAALSPTIVSTIGHFWGKSKLEAQISDLQQDLTETKRDRDSKATQLAPFLAIANQRFEAAPADKRLDLLLERIDDLTQTVRDTAARLPTKRSLSPEAITRIQTKLDFAPRVPVTIDAPLGDGEAIKLAEQIKVIFEGCGFKVNGVNQAVWTPTPEGVFLRCKRVPDGPLSAGILQLFTELGSRPTVSLNESMPESELAVTVGSK